jgi:hypothetical protein
VLTLDGLVVFGGVAVGAKAEGAATAADQQAG